MVPMVARARSNTSRRCLQLTRLLRTLVAGTVAVSSTCCLHSFFRRDTVADMNPGVYNWTTSVRLIKYRSTSPEAERLLTDAAAPLLRNTQASFEWKDGRSNVSALFCHRLSVEVFAAELPRHVCLRGTSRRHVSFFMLQAAVVNVGTVKARKTEETWGPTVGN